MSILVMFKNKRGKQNGFTVAELLAGMLLGVVLISIITSVVFTLSALNARATMRANVGARAFQEIQNYINLDFDDVPIGDDTVAYEVSDFSDQIESEFNLQDVVAKVYIEPESEIPVPITTTEQYTEAVSADTEYADGDEIEAIDTDETRNWYNDYRISDDNYSNYTYEYTSYGEGNIASPSIDLGSSQTVDVIRINWFGCNYSSSNFRIQAKDSNPTSNSGWTTISSGLSDTYTGCSNANRPQDFVVGTATPYRHWRLYFDTKIHPNYIVVSELEAFSAGTPGDTVEQRGADATVNPGELSFLTDLGIGTESTATGKQSIGLLFQGVTIDGMATVDNAYIRFTPTSNQSGSVTTLVKGVDVDSAPRWENDYAVDNAVDSDGSDGYVGTTSGTSWSPGNWDTSNPSTNTTVDVTAIVQELVNRPGWSTGNDMGFGIRTLSGSGVRYASRTVAPQLVIEWSKTETTLSGNYVDVDGDGDVDNPTLLRVTSIVEYRGQYYNEKIVYSTYMRKYGVGD